MRAQNTDKLATNNTGDWKRKSGRVSPPLCFDSTWLSRPAAMCFLGCFTIISNASIDILTNGWLEICCVIVSMNHQSWHLNGSSAIICRSQAAGAVSNFLLMDESFWCIKATIHFLQRGVQSQLLSNITSRRYGYRFVLHIYIAISYLFTWRQKLITHFLVNYI